MEDTIMLYGTKITLCSLEEAYAQQLTSFLNDVEVIQYISIVTPQTISQEKEWIEATNKSNDNIVFAIRANDKSTGNGTHIIGSVGLHNINWIDRSATFGIVIGDKDYWSSGCGSEVAFLILYWGFNSLNLVRIESSALKYNTRSIALHKKCGFVEEGMARKAAFKRGIYHDLVLFGLLREEFENTLYQK
jgi:RimJ/RimL family protein N-acetyltransferase